MVALEHVCERVNVRVEHPQREQRLALRLARDPQKGLGPVLTPGLGHRNQARLWAAGVVRRDAGAHVEHLFDRRAQVFLEAFEPGFLDHRVPHLRVIQRGETVAQVRHALHPAPGGTANRQRGLQAIDHPRAAHLRDRGDVAADAGFFECRATLFRHSEVAAACAIAAQHAAGGRVGDVREQSEFGTHCLHQTLALGHGARNLNQFGFMGKRPGNGPAVWQRVHRQAVDREARCASVYRLPHHLDHAAQLVGCGLLFDGPLAHHIEAHRAVADQAGNVDAGLDFFDRIQVTAVVLPAPGQAGQDGVARNVLDGLHHAGQQFAVTRLAGRERHAAVAQQRGGHAVPADRCAVGVPADLRVEMGVDVDEAGRHGRALRVDLAVSPAVDLAHRGDDAVFDAQIAGAAFTAAAVNDGSTANHEVIGHGLSPE